MFFGFRPDMFRTSSRSWPFRLGGHPNGHGQQRRLLQGFGDGRVARPGLERRDRWPQNRFHLREEQWETCRGGQTNQKAKIDLGDFRTSQPEQVLTFSLEKASQQARVDKLDRYGSWDVCVSDSTSACPYFNNDKTQSLKSPLTNIADEALVHHSLSRLDLRHGCFSVVVDDVHNHGAKIVL